VRVADDAGADFIGVVVEVSVSRRSVSAEAARELLGVTRRAKRSALFLDPLSDRLRELVEIIDPDVVHLTGEEQPRMLENLRKYFGGKLFKSIHLPPAEEQSQTASTEAKSSLIKKAVELIETYAGAGADMVVLDTRDVSRGLYGGTGKVSNWDAAAAIVEASPLPVLLAGGISVDNIEQAMRAVRPYGFDLASGLERKVGEKDPELVRAFMDKVRKLGRQP